MNFHQTEATLTRIMEIISRKEKGLYLRFGDGDVFLAVGRDDSYQTATTSLQSEMKEALKIQGPTIIKSLPLHCREFGGWEPGMYDGNHEVPTEKCRYLLERATPLWGGKVEDVYSATALHFSSTHKVDLSIRFLRFLKSSNTVLLVGNKNIPAELRTLLFGEKCEFVPTPPSQSYTEIDRIEKEVLQKIPQNKEYKIIITSMGCAGRCLQKRLWGKLDNIFIFDFGSLMDALCGEVTRPWITLAGFDREKFLKKLVGDDAS